VKVLARAAADCWTNVSLYCRTYSVLTEQKVLCIFTSVACCFVVNAVAVGAKPVYVANTYPPAVTPNRPMATAIKLIQTTPLSSANAVSIASYAYQPVATPSVVVCSHSVVTTPSAIGTSMVSSSFTSAMGRIPSLISGNTGYVTSGVFTLGIHLSIPTPNIQSRVDSGI